MKSKKNLFNVAVCILSGILVAIFVLTTTELEDLKQNFRVLDLKWIGAAVLLIVLQWFFEGSALHVLSRPFFRKLRLKDSFEISMSGMYFNNITPFSTGGQPFQAYTMQRMGMDLGDAMSALLSKFLVYQAVMVGVSTVFLISEWNFFHDNLSSMLDRTFLNLPILLLIGYAVNTAAFLVALMFAVFPETSKKVAAVIIRLLAKIRLIRDREKTSLYFNEKLDQCGRGFRALIHNVPVLIGTFFLTVLYLLCYVAVPYAIYRALGAAIPEGTPVYSLFTVMGAEAFVMLISCFFPMPGASIGAETFFRGFFLLFFGANVALTNVATVLWRVVTFYFTMVVGAVFVLRVNRSYGKKEPEKKETGE